MLNNDMKAIIVQANLSFVATVNEDGSPNLSPKSTLQVYDDTHLIFANLASPGTIDNLRREPRTEINCIDIFSRRGYRFTGSASVHSPGDALFEEFDQTLKQQLGPDTKMYDAVLVKLDEVKTTTGEDEEEVLFKMCALRPCSRFAQFPRGGA